MPDAARYNAVSQALFVLQMAVHVLSAFLLVWQGSVHSLLSQRMFVQPAVLAAYPYKLDELCWPGSVVLPLNVLLLMEASKCFNV